MLVCSGTQMARIDRETIAGGVAALELMERAGGAMAEAMLEFLEAEHLHGGVLVVCGKGNNGGDGLVAARLLAAHGVPVTVMLLAAPGQLAPDARANYDRLPRQAKVVQAQADLWAETFTTLSQEAGAVLDAILGTGIVPPLQDPYVELIRAINDAGLPCVGADIPSGVGADDGRVDPVAVACDLTVTVGLPKLGLLLPPGRDFAGTIEVADIGFPPEVCRKYAPDHHLLAPADYAALLPPRSSQAHKYQCGKVLVVAGSRRFGGAAHLAGLGALRSGAGLVTLAAPRCLEIPLRVGLPEALVAAQDETEAGTLAPVPAGGLDALLQGQRAVAVGPGLDAHPDTDRWVVDFLGGLDLPAVVDADGLGAFARLGTPPRFGGRQVVLTPHPGELGRLLDLTVPQIQADRFAVAAQAARRWGVVVMLKGSPSLIAAPDGRIFINPSGDDALARGGSGDVLTGLVGGLLAQGSLALEAALLGAYVHGKAGTLAAEGCSTRSVLVREAAASIGSVFESLEMTASLDADLRQKIWPV